MDAWAELQAESELAKETRPCILLHAQCVLLGRARGAREAAGQVLVSCMTVSSKHLLIEQADEPGTAAIITDSSTNGTFVNGSRIRKRERTVVHDGDVISLAGSGSHDAAGNRFLVYKLHVLHHTAADVADAAAVAPTRVSPSQQHNGAPHGSDRSAATAGMRDNYDTDALAPALKSPRVQPTCWLSANQHNQQSMEHSELIERLRRAEEKAEQEQSLREQAQTDYERVKQERAAAESQCTQEKEWKEHAQAERNKLREHAEALEQERTSALQQVESLSGTLSEERQARARAEARAEEAEKAVSEMQPKVQLSEQRASYYLRSWRELYSMYDTVSSAVASSYAAAERVRQLLDSANQSLRPTAEPPPHHEAADGPPDANLGDGAIAPGTDGAAAVTYGKTACASGRDAPQQQEHHDQPGNGNAGANAAGDAGEVNS